MWVKIKQWNRPQFVYLKKLWNSLSYFNMFKIITVPADVLAPLGARPSAGAVMTNCEPICIYIIDFWKVNLTQTSLFHWCYTTLMSCGDWTWIWLLQCHNVTLMLHSPHISPISKPYPLPSHWQWHNVTLMLHSPHIPPYPNHIRYRLTALLIFTGTLPFHVQFYWIICMIDADDIAGDSCNSLYM